MRPNSSVKTTVNSLSLHTLNDYSTRTILRILDKETHFVIDGHNLNAHFPLNATCLVVNRVHSGQSGTILLTNHFSNVQVKSRNQFLTKCYINLNYVTIS